MEVRVYASLETFSSNKCLFSRRVCCPDSVEIPYNLLLRALRFLYGDNSVVLFIDD